MGDREYRTWILEQVFSGAYNWTLFCRDETGVCRHINVCRNVHNGLTLEKMLNKEISEWGGKSCGYTVFNIDIEAIICIWVEPAEIKGQEEFRGFRVDGKYYFFESTYSIFTEEEM
jgi:hypothetical protein